MRFIWYRDFYLNLDRVNSARYTVLLKRESSYPNSYLPTYLDEAELAKSSSLEGSYLLHSLGFETAGSNNLLYLFRIYTRPDIPEETYRKISAVYYKLFQLGFDPEAFGRYLKDLRESDRDFYSLIQPSVTLWWSPISSEEGRREEPGR